MAVINTAKPQPLLTQFSIRDMELQAQALLLRAKRAADGLLAEAEKECDILRDKARAEGFSEGREEGFAKGVTEGRQAGHEAALAEVKPQLSQTWAALSMAINLIEQDRFDLEAAGINEVIKLAAAIARRVTKRQGAADPLVLIENVKEAMKLAVQAADVHIIIHPAQRATLAEELPKLQMNWPSVKHVHLMEDEAVGMGGCRILTRQGEVDASIDEQLNRVIADITQ